MLRKIGLIVLVLLVLLIGSIYSRPAAFEITRSNTLTAPPAVVYAHIADFHRWPQWSPREQRDPNMKGEYSGPESGNGAKYAWSGNKDVGEGRMTITDARPAEQVEILLETVTAAAPASAAPLPSGG